jgi:hypothetical protein
MDSSGGMIGNQPDRQRMKFWLTENCSPMDRPMMSAGFGSSSTKSEACTNTSTVAICHAPP